jgi:hypothetical protein
MKYVRLEYGVSIKQYKVKYLSFDDDSDDRYVKNHCCYVSAEDAWNHANTDTFERLGYLEPREYYKNGEDYELACRNAEIMYEQAIWFDYEYVSEEEWKKGKAI